MSTSWCTGGEDTNDPKKSRRGIIFRETDATKDLPSKSWKTNGLKEENLQQKSSGSPGWRWRPCISNSALGKSLDNEKSIPTSEQMTDYIENK